MTTERVHELIARADSMPFGAAKTAVVEEAVRYADAADDLELSFATRMELVNAYQYGAEPGKSFVPFSWCLSTYDADPKRFGGHTHTLLWYFKYMISNLTGFPEIPLDRTYAILDDMERRWRAGGHSMHAVHRYREMIAAHVGDTETEIEQFRLWSAAPRDALSDCVGCDPTGKVRHLSRHKRYEEAVGVALPVLQGRMTCREQPQHILTSLLPAYVHTGRLNEAADAHRRAYRTLRADRGELESVADHVLFCALTGNEVRALELVERHLSWLDNPPSPRAVMRFASVAALTLRRVDPDLLIRRRNAPDTAAGALAAELATQAAEVAARFDARNGSKQQSDLVTATLTAEPWVEYLPLSETARRAAERRSAAPAASSPPVVAAPPVDPGLTGDALLDHAEERWRVRDAAGARAAWAAFADRVPEAARTPSQAARLLDAHGLQVVDEDPQAALAAWRESLSAHASLGDDYRVRRARARIGMLLCQLGEVDEGVATGEEPLWRLFTDGDPTTRAGWGISLAAMQLSAGRPAEALDVLAGAEPLAELSGTPEIGVEMRLLRATVLLALDRGDEAEPELRAVQTTAAADDTQRGYAAFRLAGLLLQRDDIDGAVDAYADAAALATGPLAAEARFHRGRLLATGPRAAEAVPDLVEAVAEFTVYGAVEPPALARIELAIAYLNSGRAHEAAETAEEAAAALPGSGAAADLPRARHVVASAYRQIGELDAALELIRANNASAESDDPDGLARLREDEGDVLEAADRDGEAVPAYEAAAAGYRSSESPLDDVRALRKAARSARYAGQLDEAARLLDAVEAALLPLPSAEPAVVFHAAGLDYDRSALAARMGRREDAAMLAGRAAEGYDRIGAADNAADARLAEADLLDEPAAEPLLRQVFESVEQGTNLWYRAGYALADALRTLGRDPEADTVQARLDAATP
jgi:tetratricopeptide (TPR) repeat protein